MDRWVVETLDLKDVTLAVDYAAWHRPGRVPAQVLADIRASGIEAMEIYRSGNRLVMITDGGEDHGSRLLSDESRAWEDCMDQFQRRLPWAEPATKWHPADRLFDLAEHMRI